MIFRKVALERLSSPEQLDQLMQVTNPQGWLALAGLCALLLAALLWGVFGSIPTEIAGEGILIQGGVSDLVAPTAGQIEEVLVAVGAVIKKGDVVARIHQESLERQINDARAKGADLQAQYEAALRASAEQRRLRERDFAQQRANLERTIETLSANVALWQQRVTEDQQLLKDGLITKQTFLDAQQSLNTARDQLASARQDLGGLDLKNVTAERDLVDQLAAKKNALNDLRLQIQEDVAKLRESVSVISPFSGKVNELLVARGDVVNPGTPILQVEQAEGRSEKLSAVLFVPAAQGKLIHQGLPAQISPTTVKREEYGFMLGRVTQVANFPSSPRGMTRRLGNEALVTNLMKEGPRIQIDVELSTDPRTPTGYRWSSSRGPNVQVSSGTLATGSIIVKEERPVSLVIPTVREKLGL
jgi:HlyD family secretion protein